MCPIGAYLSAVAPMGQGEDSENIVCSDATVNGRFTAWRWRGNLLALSPIRRRRTRRVGPASSCTPGTAPCGLLLEPTPTVHGVDPSRAGRNVR